VLDLAAAGFPPTAHFFFFFFHFFLFFYYYLHGLGPLACSDQNLSATMN
jgi:hypothetical protein